MNDTMNPYRSWGMPAIEAPVDERVGFIRKTYLHLTGAILGMVAIDATLLNLPITENLVLSMRQPAWIVLMLAFVGVAWLASYWANSQTSVPMQYAGLILYVVAEAVIFLPMLWYANKFVPEAIPAAGLITAVVFGGLTAIVFMTRADFSFLRTALMIGGIASIGVVVAAYFFGFNLGVFFSGAMILFACGYILYDTSNVLHNYRVGQHVAAALALFASVALLFYYVLRLVMALSSRD